MHKSDSRHRGKPAQCQRCRQHKVIMARRLCEACYSSVIRYGGQAGLDRYPPARQSATYTLETGPALRRAEQYWQLTTGPGALGRNQACSVLGISTRTAHRYEAWIRAQQDDTRGE